MSKPPEFAGGRAPPSVARVGIRTVRGVVHRVSTLGSEYVGRYRLLNIVKTGQTSQVWSAMDDEKRLRVAVKMLLRDFRRDREQIGYLKHEFEVGRGLDSDRVIRIYEFATDRGIPYLAMELCTINNMKDAVLRHAERIAPLVPKITEEAAEGLAYFNRQGWIHRDVKPDNFLVDDEGGVKLIDFALAQKKMGSLARLFSGKPKIQGTRSYMSPEQIRGEPLDERADVYSFGCTLHELVSGKPPYAAPSANELLVRHLKAPPPSLEGLDANVTPEFAQLVRRMMSKKPDDRPASVDEFLREYRAVKLYKRPPEPPADGG